MKDTWRDFERDDWRESWEPDRYKPLTLGEAYGQKKSNLPSIEFPLVKQLVGAIVLFFAFLWFLSWNNPKVLSFQQGLKYLLVEEKSDFTPVLEAMVREGLWTDSYDRAVFNNEKKQEVVREKALMSIPVSGKYARNFGWIESSVTGERTFHSGIDIQTELGAPVRAALDGTVIRVEKTNNLGRVIEIDHGNNLTTIYGTLGEILVEKKQKVKQGDIIGKTGSVNKSSKGQLHFEVKENGKAVDPLDKITNVRTSI